MTVGPTGSGSVARRQLPDRFDPDIERQFRESRVAGFSAINRNTFWSIAILLLMFAPWDAYVDPAHWRSAFKVRLIGAAVIVATGLLQQLPGRTHLLPLMAKIRLVISLVAATAAASTLDRGYGFAVAGVVAIILTGPYIAIDVRDLLTTNLVALLALGIVMVAVSLDPLDMIGTTVFVLLAMAVSMLLGRVLEALNRRAFALELELQRDARTDALTGLDNRRAIQERAPLELKRARRAGVPVSLLLCDIDRFKNINDRYGHEAGDAVLRSVAATLRATVRETDLLGRWGGEEFLAVLVDADAGRAADVAERMRANVAATPLDGLPEPPTISIGVSTRANLEPIADAWEALLKEADTHLYRAKSAGRNRVVTLADKG